MKKAFKFTFILVCFYILSFFVFFEKSSRAVIFGKPVVQIYSMRKCLSKSLYSSKESYALLEKIYFIYYPIRQKLSSNPVSLYGAWEAEFDETNRERIRKALDSNNK